MPLSLRKLNTPLKRNGPVVVLVADGVGIAPPAPSNAITLANTPTLDMLASQKLYCELIAHGTAVGLPSDDDMGNSEVGHNAIGAGRIFAQGAKLVNTAIDSGKVYETDVWKTAIQLGKNATLHFMGLHSDGNIHSHNKHLYELMHKAAEQGVKQCCLHLLLDGRDVGARTALEYLAKTEQVIAKINTTYNANFRIASGGGRMSITMDRYEADWNMVKRGYECHTHGVGEPFTSATQAVESLYESEGKDDQYLPAFVIEKNGEAVGKMKDGDALIFYNFRGDRAMEISQAYEDADFVQFNRNAAGQHPNIYYAGMLQYDGDALIPKNYLVNPPKIDRTMGEYIVSEGIPLFAISETQKFGHVTYFWNGNRSGYLDSSLETYIEIPSDNIEFNLAPAMKAREITEQTINLIESGNYRHGRLNLANGDMVGHTGDIKAAISAIEVVDECVAKLLKCIEKHDGILIYTADHGNADVMYTEKDGEIILKTSHTLNPVPFAIFDPSYNGEYTLAPNEDAGLTSIAATVLNLLGYQAPDDYRDSLISFNQ